MNSVFNRSYVFAVKKSPVFMQEEQMTLIKRSLLILFLGLLFMLFFYQWARLPCFKVVQKFLESWAYPVFLSSAAVGLFHLQTTQELSTASCIYYYSDHCDWYVY